MKNNKGFTLIELLAVVAILITVVAILTPKIFKQFKTAENITNQEQINSLINTAKIYMNQNSNLLPEENNIYIISLNELKHSGLIQTKEILNPSTKEELTGCIIVKYENNKYKYEYKEENEQITVTFDPQGGTLQETSKNVILGEKYGTLPIPTREGYTFMGWNGKNLLNLEKYIENSDYCKITSKEIKIVKSESHTLHTGLNIDLIEGLRYTISGNIVGEYTGRIYAFFGNSLYYYNVNNNKFIRKFTYNSSDDKARLAIYQNNASSALNTDLISDEVIIYNIQLEEGDTATPYEPYYITPSTTVVQQNNHTLKAIWKANS